MASFEVDYLNIESLYEAEPSLYDVPSGSDCRIILTSRFKNDVESLVADKQEKVRELISSLYGQTFDDVRTILNARNAKKFVGISPATFKFRVNQAERIVFTYGNTILNNDLIKETDIIFLAYVEIHDTQEQLAVEARNDIEQAKVAYSKVVSKVEEIVGTCYHSECEIVQPLYFASSDLPILTQTQQDFVKVQPPVIFRGSAGSGKTILSLEFYKMLQKTEKNIAYITLTDNMRKHAERMLKLVGVKNLHCYTFESFANKQNGAEIIRNPERLIEIPPKHKKQYPSLSESNIYTYIRGVIKGGLLSGKRKEFCGLISLEDFYAFAKNEKLGIDAAKIVYDAAVKYQSQLVCRNKYDDNDLAAQLLKEPKNVDCIIVDEVQDLTELQILALVKCCPSQKIFFFGDPNQVINPTVVDFGKIGAVFYDDFQKTVDQHVLKETWRSGPLLIEYINKLTRLRKRFIGRQDWQDDENEKSMRLGLDETYWASYVDDPNVVEKILDLATLSKDCIIIVSDEESLKKFETKYPQLQGRVFSVIGIKGLEYRDVIIYNVIGDNQQYFLDMLAEKGKRSTLHRMVFNKYYVACTRAQDRVFICESNDFDERLKTTLLFEQGVPRNNDYSTLCKLFSTTKNKNDWLKEALKLKDAEAYKQAKFAFLRADDQDSAQVMDWYIELNSIESEEYGVAESTNRIRQLAMNFFDFREFEKAEELFLRINDKSGAVLAKKCAGKSVSQKEVAEAIKKYPKISLQTIYNIAKSDYIDRGNDEINRLTKEISNLEVV